MAKRICKYCGKEFEVVDKRALYCNKFCKNQYARDQRHINFQLFRDEYVSKDAELICGREDCMFHRSRGNQCAILTEVYRDDMKCSFFKEKQ